MNVKAQIPVRDLSRERVFLEQAAGFASPSAFVEHCEQRLEQGERDFGDRWTRLDLAAFVHELREEAADLGAWAALAAQQADFLGLHSDQAELVNGSLESIARQGAQAHYLAGVLERLVNEGRSKETSHG